MHTTSVVVIGLGYVGLPLAVGIARHFPTIGFDISTDRVKELKSGHDRTGEIEADRLRASTIHLTADQAEIKGKDVYIVTVPTPVDLENRPDLGPVLKACATVGKAMGKGAVVVFESTVYPGVTEDICGPELERVSGLKCGADFFLGYSPERINPGDKEHTVDRITKVIAGQTPAITETLAGIYGAVTTGGVFRAASIKVAEAAKVIENSQRDINIAFVNELAMIFQKLGISIHDVLEASATKWNFLNFKPGLVGGHCIGVDPFYLATCALNNGHHPEIILSGRRINDGMGPWMAARISEQLAPKSRVLMLGLTFKENVPDLRNSKVIDVIRGLIQRGHTVDIHDPFADIDEARHEYDVELMAGLDGASGYDCVVGAVPHDAYAGFGPEAFAKLVARNGLVADIKGMWRNTEMPDGIRVWRL
ncbi:nucleotide sugar dehydrogenase [Magnetospirillum moscoviense]|uniref:UDP-N-acetyl-D-galactosamine dehydrogenase n=1 Tax=Magnetospirillum moscoviense TaxID=1437059 RepID=A0A178MX55_9PROT|nr:nucleotide sugar dehydrogenase [Magnetospirillum moscoviense]MBF0326126.1 nucleotide sugar dehydrogenase [Alphaproteobacteria bacterium]OAN55113.1 UDP-N-acetyl-D-galactosamine dehydrogenase [Magnetospirillum moscoviense]